MNNRYLFDRRQLTALTTVMLLTPALRLYPSATAELSGKAAWLCMPVAFPVILLYMWFLSRFMSRRKEGEGLAELIIRAMGRHVGKAVLILFSLWTLLYMGFVLRSGADRLITTIYPHSPQQLFSVTMGLVALIAALCPVRSIVRSAKLVLPAVIGILLLVLSFALFSVHPQNLFPVTFDDTLPALRGSLVTVNVFSVALYIVCFLEGMSKKSKWQLKSSALWLAGISILLFLLILDIIGNFGAELTAQLTRPFFTLVRNLVFFRSLERVESLVVALWILPDFILAAVFLYTAQYCLRLVFGFSPESDCEQLSNLQNGRWIICLSAAAAILFSVFLAPTPTSLSFWSDRLIPIINLSVSFVLIPSIYLCGRIRKTL